MNLNRHITLLALLTAIAFLLMIEPAHGEAWVCEQVIRQNTPVTYCHAASVQPCVTDGMDCFMWRLFKAYSINLQWTK